MKPNSHPEDRPPRNFGWPLVVGAPMLTVVGVVHAMDLQVRPVWASLLGAVGGCLVCFDFWRQRERMRAWKRQHPADPTNGG